MTNWSQKKVSLICSERVSNKSVTLASSVTELNRFFQNSLWTYERDFFLRPIGHLWSQITLWVIFLQGYDVRSKVCYTHINYESAKIYWCFSSFNEDISVRFEQLRREKQKFLLHTLIKVDFFLYHKNF
jgi:hypothetical protein